MHLGIDLDNTLVLYDRAFHEAAVERRLVPRSMETSKRAIRDHVRTLVDGEALWTRLQGEVYANRMNRAELAPGAERLLAECARRGVRVSIVSHKTQFPADGPRVDLRKAAMAWMRRTPCLTALPVFFEPTRDAKVARITELRCTHFVDDLVEVFEEPSFPAHVVRILCGAAASLPDVVRLADLDAVHDRLFGAPA